jgi:hypothetical protein
MQKDTGRVDRWIHDRRRPGILKCDKRIMDIGLHSCSEWNFGIIGDPIVPKPFFVIKRLHDAYTVADKNKGLNENEIKDNRARASRAIADDVKLCGAVPNWIKS